MFWWLFFPSRCIGYFSQVYRKSVRMYRQNNLFSRAFVTSYYVGWRWNGNKVVNFSSLFYLKRLLWPLFLGEARKVASDLDLRNLCYLYPLLMHRIGKCVGFMNLLCSYQLNSNKRLTSLDSTFLILINNHLCLYNLYNNHIFIQVKVTLYYS